MPEGCVSVKVREKNNNRQTNVTYCNFCIKSQTKYNEKEYSEHLATHYENLFKCSVCKYGFVTWNNAWRHVNNHWSSRKKINSCVEWSCRFCNNGGRRFSGHLEAFRHAELHVAGLIVTSREGEEDSDSTSGGFSSGYDCVSSEEGESDLSSVSERETE